MWLFFSSLVSSSLYFLTFCMLFGLYFNLCHGTIKVQYMPQMLNNIFSWALFLLSLYMSFAIVSYLLKKNSEHHRERLWLLNSKKINNPYVALYIFNFFKKKVSPFLVDVHVPFLSKFSQAVKFRRTPARLRNKTLL